MKIHQLHWDDKYLHPSIVNEFRHTARVQGIINDIGIVKYKSLTFTLKNADMESLPPGTPVYIWLTNNFQCASVNDVEKDQEERKQAHAEAERTYKESIEQKRLADKQRAVEVNSKIKLPVSWSVGIKDVLSGLSERSDGTGRKSNTVNHIMLPDGLSLDRLKLEPGDFLCTTNNGNNGKQWSSQPYESLSKKNMPEVTCTSCLKIAHGICEKVSNLNERLLNKSQNNIATSVNINTDIDR